MFSGIARYNEDPMVTWRTAFREVIKLLVDDTDISHQRLVAWMTPTYAKNSEMSVKGAQDGVNYFNEVQGDMEKLLYSFEWDWLATRYQKFYQ